MKKISEILFFLIALAFLSSCNIVKCSIVEATNVDSSNTTGNAVKSRLCVECNTNIDELKKAVKLTGIK